VPAAVVVVELPETPSAHLPLPLDTHIPLAESVLPAAAAVAIVVAAVAGTAVADMDMGILQAHPDLSVGGADTANNSAPPGAPLTGVGLAAAAVPDPLLQVGVAYGAAVVTKVHREEQKEGVGLAAAGG